MSFIVYFYWGGDFKYFISLYLFEIIVLFKLKKLILEGGMKMGLGDRGIFLITVVVLADSSVVVIYCYCYCSNYLICNWCFFICCSYTCCIIHFCCSLSLFYQFLLFLVTLSVIVIPIAFSIFVIPVVLSIVVINIIVKNSFFTLI